ncbi:MAG: hypothetical protein WC114_09520 [Smithellaceae bacterium]
MNLDVRDVEALVLEAQRQDIHEKMHALRMSRMAWAEADVVKNEMDRLLHALELIDGPAQKKYCKTWTELLGKRKG